MKRFYALLLLSGIILLAACGGAENKVDTEDTAKKVTTDTTQISEPAKTEPEKKPPAAEPRSGSVDSPSNSRKNNILANIDKHVISSVSGTSVTLQNTLSDASFQRVYVDVSEVNDAGQPVKTDFYSVVNLEPGGTKSFKIPATSGKLSIHIIKAKSDELTGGEMILVGSRYSPK